MAARPPGPERPFDLAVAGELNLDLILYGLPLELPTERDLVGTGFASTLGSSSAIVAHNAAALGLRVQFSTLIGDDHFGSYALEWMRQGGVDIAGAIVDPSKTTGITILLPHQIERHSLSYLGAISALTPAHLDLGRLAQARHFHLSSLYLQRGLHAGIVDLLAALKSEGLTISVDTNDDPDDVWGAPLPEILPLVDLFMPNERELCRMAGGVDFERAVQIFGEKVPILIIKRGRHGCRVKQGEQSLDVPGLNVQPIDTIGAGDSFDAGFLECYLRGNTLAACARAGNISGALSTQSHGGTEAFRDVTFRQAFLKEHGYFDR